MIDHRNYDYFTNGKVKNIFTDYGTKNYFIDYQNTDNAMQVSVFIQQDSNIIIKKSLIETFRNFKFDDKPKPDCGTGNIIQFDPMPSGFFSEASFESNISKNNMTEFVGGTKWFYTYNENNLPSTIEMQWKDVITTEPMLLRITYKESKE
jgi:hypothetical protein